MTTIQSFIRLRCLRSTLAALGVAAMLASFGASEASAQRGRRVTATATAPAPAQAQESGDGVVNIQTATAEQLQLLPGVGPAKAQAIVSSRERRAFRRVEDILRVRGIGRATFRRLRPMLTVDGPTTLSTRVRPARQAPSNEPEDAEEQD